MQKYVLQKFHFLNCYAHLAHDTNIQSTRINMQMHINSRSS